MPRHRDHRVANQVVVPIGADGSVQPGNFAGGADAVVDLFEYYGPKGEALFRPTTPKRLVDTRTAGHGALGVGGQLTVPTGAPAGASGAVVNLTATAPTAAAGYLTARPGPGERGSPPRTARPGGAGLSATDGPARGSGALRHGRPGPGERGSPPRTARPGGAGLSATDGPARRSNVTGGR
ncbi:hypothetical protein [Kitasatospora sp. MMS16-BH015]|uniref:hypothetical protein n=1 Tax=Kitasatospora sp. MMS16-BH015 TaxID=2018025 RepID=UPI000CF2D68C|nr:hypothetical protein [Kitasatospora sp. MMS16-BH015]